MPRRWKWLLVLLLVPILLIGAAAVILLGRDKEPKKPQTIPIGDYTYTKALAEHHMEQVMDQHHIPGAAAALIVDQEIIWQKPFGLANLDPETPVTEDTVFKLWSLAKPFTAIETMQLVEEGLVDLDAPIDTYIPGFSIQSRFPDVEPITIRRILAHRSGLPRNACVKETRLYTGSEAIERLVASLEECFLAFQTGTRYKYSNVGYGALGAIIQEQRGQIFPGYMKENLLEPLGMENSSFWSADLPEGSRLGEPQNAIGYEYFEGEHYTYEQYDIASVPSGNLYATIGDLAEFVRFIFRGGEAGGDQLIAPETLSAMFEDQYSTPTDPQLMGLGWKISPVLETEKMVWHDGGPSEGIGGLIAMIPDRKIGVVLLANSTSFDGSTAVPIAVDLLEAMLEAGHGLVEPEEEPVEPYPVEPAVLENYQGSYGVFGEIMDVTLAGDKLKGSIDGMSFDLVPAAENRFRVTHWLYKLGLADFLPLPMDLRELEIEFQVGDGTSQDIIIINLGDIFYEVGPRYPDQPQEPAALEAIGGRYGLYDRLPSGNANSEKLGETEIEIVDGQLSMPGNVGPMLLIDDRTLIILSGSFAGETISYDPETGYLFHQSFVYKPLVEQEGG